MLGTWAGGGQPHSALRPRLRPSASHVRPLYYAALIRGGTRDVPCAIGSAAPQSGKNTLPRCGETTVSRLPGVNLDSAFLPVTCVCSANCKNNPPPAFIRRVRHIGSNCVQTAPSPSPSGCSVLSMRRCFDPDLASTACQPKRSTRKLLPERNEGIIPASWAWGPLARSGTPLRVLSHLHRSLLPSHLCSPAPALNLGTCPQRASPPSRRNVARTSRACRYM